MVGGYRCAVGICNNQSQKEPKISFFRFPKDKKLQKEWIRRCFRKDTFNPGTSRICKVHFSDNDFQTDLKAKLMNLPEKAQLKPGGK